MSTARVRTIVHDNYITFSAAIEEEDFNYATVGLGLNHLDRCRCIKENLIAEYRQHLQQYMHSQCLVNTIDDWLNNNPDIQSLNENLQIFIPTGEGTQLQLDIIDDFDHDTRYLSFQSLVHGYKIDAPLVFQMFQFDVTVDFVKTCVDNIVDHHIPDQQRKMDIFFALVDQISEQDLQLTNIISIEC